MKLLILIALLASTQTFASTAYLSTKSDVYEDLEIQSVSTIMPYFSDAGAVEIQVANTKKNQTNFLRINKNLLSNMNMDSASFMQLIMNKDLDVMVMCLDATSLGYSGDLYYKCGNLALRADPKKSE